MMISLFFIENSIILLSILFLVKNAVRAKNSNCDWINRGFYHSFRGSFFQNLRYFLFDFQKNRFLFRCV